MKVKEVKKLKADDNYIVAAFKITPLASYRNDTCALWLALRAHPNERAEVFARSVVTDDSYNSMLTDSHVYWNKVYKLKGVDDYKNRTAMVGLNTNERKGSDEELFVCAMDPLLAFWYYHRKLVKKRTRDSWRTEYKDSTRVLLRNFRSSYRRAYTVEPAFYCSYWVDERKSLVERLQLLELSGRLIDDAKTDVK